MRKMMRGSALLALGLALTTAAAADELSEAAAELKSSREAIEARMKKQRSGERKAMSLAKKGAKRAAAVLKIVAGHEKELADTKKRLEDIQKLPARTNEEIQNRRAGIAAMEKREKTIRGKLKNVAGQVKKLQERGGSGKLDELLEARRAATLELRGLEHRAGSLGREPLATLDASAAGDLDKNKPLTGAAKAKFGAAGASLSSKLESLVVTAGEKWILRDQRKRRSYYLEASDGGIAVRGPDDKERPKALESEIKKLEKACDKSGEELTRLEQASETAAKINTEFEAIVSKYGA